MDPTRTTFPGARAMRLIHLALTLGLSLCAVVFFIVRRVTPLPALPQGSVIALALTVAAISILAVAFTVVRPRVPMQPPEQTQDAYWSDRTVRGTVMLLWAAVEGAGLLAAVGYLLTGGTAPAIAFVLGIVTLASLWPGRFQQDDG